ncbi:helix-turn-helix transcriptional regulator [Lysobacter fragariae]
MIIERHLLRVAQTLDLTGAASDRLHLLEAQGRGAEARVPHGWLSLWLPLRGDMAFEATPSLWQAAPRQLLVSREALRGGSRRINTWLALAGSFAAWNTWLHELPEPVQANEILARQWSCPRALQRHFVQLARALRSPGDGAWLRAAAESLCATLLDSQRELQPLVDRCNGRSAQRRRLTLQRLLRVHQMIERDGEGRMDLAQLAAGANYSPWHLIRMYRDVFGETPHEHAARLRLSRAWQLVRGSAMPVCEITEALGFESQSAFCRAFKNAYGLTTTQVRHQPPVRMTSRPKPGRTRKPSVLTA